MTEPLKEKLIAKTLGMKEKPQENINEVKEQAENMSVIEGTIETAKKLAGTSELSEQLRSERERGERLEKEKDKATEQLHAAELQNVRTELSGKIDHLIESINAGASRKSLGDEIGEIKKAATELGMGSSRLSEIQEMMSIIDKLNPRKGLAEQVKEAKDLLTTLQSPQEKGKEATVEGVPAQVAIELKKMDHNLQITLAKMADDRQHRDQEFQLTLRKYDEERVSRQEKLQMDYQILQERNQLIADGFKLVGRAAGKAYAEALGKTSEATVTVAGAADKDYHIEVGEGESGTMECPHCKKPVGVGPTTRIAQCVGCNTKYEVRRTTKPGAAAASHESEEEQ